MQDVLSAYPHTDTGDVVRSLGEKYDISNPDVTAEIEELKAIRDQQQEYLEKAPD
ncbi:MAG: hypothetical protein MR991_08195 [Clostridiales bacterium]|nr:hypothetical protein [Clostridiales bacterium]MDD7034935.1 hypothetical protein [Bacillota bacterium]MDY2920304.1 hypothetical protein [Lentihominibacter sp.]